MEGRVEICYSNTYGTVCDDFWDELDARVVCQQLFTVDGKYVNTVRIYSSTFTIYTFAGIPLKNAAYGPGTVDILLDNVVCQGNESDLLICSRSEIGQNDCTHSEDASVQCGGMYYIIYNYTMCSVCRNLAIIIVCVVHVLLFITMSVLLFIFSLQCHVWKALCDCDMTMLCQLISSLVLLLVKMVSQEAGLRCVSMGPMALCVMTPGTMRMLLWSVHNWDYRPMVSHHQHKARYDIIPDYV